MIVAVWTKIRKSWKAVAATTMGMVMGVGIFTLYYAKGWSYLTNNPQSCANCHTMQPYLDAWQHGSHRAVATCNDCHTPAHPIKKWLVKGNNGFWHSYAFTMQDFPEHLQIKPGNLEVTEAQCRHCHAQMVHQVDRQLACTQCHSRVGHDQ